MLEKAWFATQQESCKKNVERAFGVIQARFAIFWYPGHIWKVMNACVVMHNMISGGECVIG
jgi:hypothetical protein